MALVDPASLAPEIHVPAFRLNGQTMTARLSQLVIDGEIESTVEGASTLTLNVQEQDRELRKMIARGLFTVPVIKGKRRTPARPILPAFREGTKMKALGLDWELVHFDKVGDGWTFVFEDARVAGLRRLDKPRKVARDKVTRAQFIKSITAQELKRPKIQFVCPELKKEQPIANSRDRKKETDRQDERERGINPRQNLKIRGADATPAQLRMAERHLDTVAAFKGPEAVALATCMIGINETGFVNKPFSSDGLSRGVMQLLNSIAARKGIDNMDPERVVRFWLEEGAASNPGALGYYRANPGATPAKIAQVVWGGTGFPLSTWTQWADEARALVDAYGGSEGSFTRVREKKYEFSRGRPGGPAGEDSWEAGLRMAEEVGWRLFMVRDKLYYISEEDLISSKVRAVLREGERGVETIDYNVDAGHAIDQATVTARSRLWLVPPGAVVQVAEQGPASGRWLVSTVRRGIFDTSTTIELRRNRALLPEKAEPAPETVQRTIRGKLGREEGESGGIYDKFYDELVRISGLNLPYTWGGGHNSAFAPSAGGGYDCSGYISAGAHAAGILDSPLTSGLFMSWGEPGVGKHFTIWCNEGHVFAELYGRDWQRADTSAQGSGGNGPHVRSNHRDHGGFTPRHWPGN